MDFSLLDAVLAMGMRLLELINTYGRNKGCEVPQLSKQIAAMHKIDFDGGVCTPKEALR